MRGAVILLALIICLSPVAAIPSQSPDTPDLGQGSDPQSDPADDLPSNPSTEEPPEPTEQETTDQITQATGTGVDDVGADQVEQQAATGVSWIVVGAASTVVLLLLLLVAVLLLRRRSSEESNAQTDEIDLEVLKAACKYVEDLRARGVDESTIASQLKKGSWPDSYVRVALKR